LGFFFELKNEKKSQMNSLTNRKITATSHKNWFLKNIKNKDNILLVAIKSKKNKVGIVRYDLSQYFAEISIIVDPKYRGQGLGSKILKKSEIFLKNGTIIISKVKKKNITSLAIFKKNSYNILYLKNKVYNLYKVFKNND
jgi:ribosomal protein S18 acetylase RimI-like enzyme